MNRGAMVAAAAALLVGASASAEPAPAAATAAPPAPQNGADSLGVPFAPRTGFYLETQLGVFFSFGGEKSYSNSQPWIAGQIGFEIPNLNVGTNVLRHAAVFITGGQGFNDGDCHILDNQLGGCLNWTLATNSAPAMSAENFSVAPVEVGTRLGFTDIGVQGLFPYVTVAVGATFLAPQLAPTGGNIGFHFGVGVGLEYQTRLEGFNFAIEALFRGAIVSWSKPADMVDGALSGSLFLPQLTIYPRFQYVF
jgi:hypothetical protein